MTLLTIEWFAAAFAMVGTILLASKGRWAGYGFVLYLVSNVAWLAFAWTRRDWAILAQNAAFLGSSVMGIWIWLLEPRAPLFWKVYRATRAYRGRLASARVALRCSR